MAAFCGKCRREVFGDQLFAPCEICSQQTEPYFFEKEDFIKNNQATKKQYSISEIEFKMIEDALVILAKKMGNEKDRRWIVQIANDLSNQWMKHRMN